MRVCPPICEWFRGCPNPALIYYAFSDKWLCSYCIGYARIGVPACTEDGWRRGTCVNPESQNWFCDLHANRCDAIIERPSGRSTGNSHRCMRTGTMHQDNHTSRYYCISHMPDNRGPPSLEPATRRRPALPSITNTIVLQASTPTPHQPGNLPRISIPLPSLRASYQPRRITTSRRQALGTGQSHNRVVPRALAPRSAVPRAVSRPLNHTPYVASQPQGLVARIASAIASLSAVLLSPESDLPPSLTDVVPAVQNTSAVAAAVPLSMSRLNLDVFSTVVDTECCICLEPQRSMRRLISCKHMFCAECLSKQVNGPYARAHDCPLCRKDMFEGTDWETY